jgi:glycosyltransferase involved in cell wall biosynthesis
MVRHTLKELDALGESETILLVRSGEQAAELWREFNYPTVIADELAREPVDAVWYPWNGMRFTPHAPAIVTVHDVFAFTYPHRNFVARWREQAPIKRAIKEADAILAVSRWTASEIYRIFRVRKDRLKVVPNALDSFWHAVDVPAAAPYMLVLAGPEERKNVGMLLRAYEKAFGDAGPQLIVAGTLSEQDERLFTKMRAPRVRMRPTDEELRLLYSGAVAVLVPSLAEGFGLPVLEAMACGTAVIASNAGALPETCEGAGMLVHPDENAWRSALRIVASDESLRSDLQRRGLERVQRIDRTGPARALLESVRQLRANAR